MRSSRSVLALLSAAGCFWALGCTRTSPVFLDDLSPPAQARDFGDYDGSEDDACSEPIKLESGWIKGLAEDDAESCVWRGVPYAKAQRWKAPALPDAWEGILDASHWGAQCMQRGGFRNWLINWDPSGTKSEDCLFVNVWRPRRKGKLPVLVFLHGGGLAFGTANSGYHWGDRLADAGDVVYVNLNYRLGSFGFFAAWGPLPRAPLDPRSAQRTTLIGSRRETLPGPRVTSIRKPKRPVQRSCV